MNLALENFSFRFNDLNLDVDIVEETMGYERGQSPEPFPEMISNALSQCENLTDIKGSLLITENFIPDNLGCINIEGVSFFVGKKIVRQLKNAEGGALFICTAGAGIGEKSRDLMAMGEFMEGYILDIIGSLTVEAAIERIQNNLGNEMLSLGKKLANRYSPGYCGWALSEQKQLFGLFPDNYCGISLSESCLMEPTKSLSGIIGFGPDLTRTAFECDMCELKTCTYRKMRIAKYK